MSPTIPVFFDFACPWSYAARARERRLARELGVRFEYLPWELGTDVPSEGVENPFATPTEELVAFAASAGVEIPVRPVQHRTHKALKGLLVARAHHAHEAYVDAAFRAYWREEANLDDDAVLARIAMRSGLDPAPFVAAVNDAAWSTYLQGVDALGEKLGVATTVTYLLPPGDAPDAYQGLGSYEELRSTLASRVSDGGVTA